MQIPTLVYYLVGGGATLRGLLVLVRDWPAKRRYLDIMNERAEIENDRLREESRGEGRELN